MKLDYGLKQYLVEQREKHTSIHSFEEIGQFSMTWPLVAFADRNQSVFVANCFNRSNIYHFNVDDIEGLSLAKSQSSAKEECGVSKLTFITKNNQLYVLAFRNEEYILLKADLSEMNTFKLDQFVETMEKKHAPDNGVTSPKAKNFAL